jgi:hypothetical protein
VYLIAQLPRSVESPCSFPLAVHIGSLTALNDYPESEPHRLQGNLTGSRPMIGGSSPTWISYIPFISFHHHLVNDPSNAHGCAATERQAYEAYLSLNDVKPVLDASEAIQRLSRDTQWDFFKSGLMNSFSYCAADASVRARRRCESPFLKACILVLHHDRDR